MTVRLNMPAMNAVLKTTKFVMLLLLTITSCREKFPVVDDPTDDPVEIPSDRDSSGCSGISMDDMPCVEVSDEPLLKVASYNIWSPSGRTGDKGAKTEELKEILKWENAAVAVAECIKADFPDIIGLNEVSGRSFDIFGLLPSYEKVIFDKNGTPVISSSQTSGLLSLSCCLLYSPDVVELKESGVFRTAPKELDGAAVRDHKTGEEVDVCNEQRHCVWALFTHLESGEDFHVFCLHNDVTYSYTDAAGQVVKDERSQCANAETVLAQAGRMVSAGNRSIILGDFNATAGDASFELFRSSDRWTDAYEEVSLREGTYITSGRAITTMNAKDNETLSTIRPDHILSDGFNVVAYGVDRNKYRSSAGDYIFPSDHFLVYSLLDF